MPLCGLDAVPQGFTHYSKNRRSGKAMASRSWDQGRFRRLAWTASGLFAAVVAIMLAPSWLWLILTPAIRRQTAIGFLIGLELAYGAAVVTALIGTPIFGSSLYRAWRNGATGQPAARGLLLWRVPLARPRVGRVNRGGPPGSDQSGHAADEGRAQTF